MSCVCKEIVRDLSLRGLAGQARPDHAVSDRLERAVEMVAGFGDPCRDNLITFTRQRSDTMNPTSKEHGRMGRLLNLPMRIVKPMRCSFAFVIAAQFIVPFTSAQDTPLISGGIGFITSTNGGNTTYVPLVEPVLAAPLGHHVLVESRASLVESRSFPKTRDDQGIQARLLFWGLSVFHKLDVMALLLT